MSLGAPDLARLPWLLGNGVNNTAGKNSMFRYSSGFIDSIVLLDYINIMEVNIYALADLSAKFILIN